ncbi:hypothetical protein M8J77_022957 [Diaphorina citri]|nr:hypothetical protein M8J77_022957 [Diaphorina citri]
MYKYKHITAHYFCVLMSSQLQQKGEDDEGFFGFLIQDLDKELNRAKSVKCCFCKRGGATAQCNFKSPNKQKCQLTFHLTCGVTQGTLHYFFGKFQSLCHMHRRPQRVPTEYIKDSAVQCLICFDFIQDVNSTSSSLWAPCCKKYYFHKDCVQRLAYSSGEYHFRCPLCNNQDKFKQAMLRCGIFLPIRDAEWEREPNAFSELYIEHNQCDKEPCLCPHSNKDGNKRLYNKGAWDLIRCSTCGSEGTHRPCSGLPLSGDVTWDCASCRQVIKRQTESASGENLTPCEDDMEEQSVEPDTCSAHFCTCNKGRDYMNTKGMYRTIYCEDCELSWIHARCRNVEQRSTGDLTEKGNTPWTCRDCLTSDSEDTSAAPVQTTSLSADTAAIEEKTKKQVSSPCYVLLDPLFVKPYYPKISAHLNYNAYRRIKRRVEIQLRQMKLNTERNYGENNGTLEENKLGLGKNDRDVEGNDGDLRESNRNSRENNNMGLCQNNHDSGKHKLDSRKINHGLRKICSNSGGNSRDSGKNKRGLRENYCDSAEYDRESRKSNLRLSRRGVNKNGSNETVSDSESEISVGMEEYSQMWTSLSTKYGDQSTVECDDESRSEFGMSALSSDRKSGKSGENDRINESEKANIVGNARNEGLEIGKVEENRRTSGSENDKSMVNLNSGGLESSKVGNMSSNDGLENGQVIKDTPRKLEIDKAEGLGIGDTVGNNNPSHPEILGALLDLDSDSEDIEKKVHKLSNNTGMTTTKDIINNETEHDITISRAMIEYDSDQLSGLADIEAKPTSMQIIKQTIGNFLQSLTGSPSKTKPNHGDLRVDEFKTNGTPSEYTYVNKNTSGEKSRDALVSENANTRVDHETTPGAKLDNPLVEDLKERLNEMETPDDGNFEGTVSEINKNIDGSATRKTERNETKGGDENKTTHDGQYDPNEIANESVESHDNEFSDSGISEMKENNEETFDATNSTDEELAGNQDIVMEVESGARNHEMVEAMEIDSEDGVRNVRSEEAAVLRDATQDNVKDGLFPAVLTEKSVDDIIRNGITERPAVLKDGMGIGTTVPTTPFQNDANTKADVGKGTIKNRENFDKINKNDGSILKNHVEIEKTDSKRREDVFDNKNNEEINNINMNNKGKVENNANLIAKEKVDDEYDRDLMINSMTRETRWSRRKSELLRIVDNNEINAKRAKRKSKYSSLPKESKDVSPLKELKDTRSPRNKEEKIRKGNEHVKETSQESMLNDVSRRYERKLRKSTVPHENEATKPNGLSTPDRKILRSSINQLSNSKTTYFNEQTDNSVNVVDKRATGEEPINTNAIREAALVWGKLSAELNNQLNASKLNDTIALNQDMKLNEDPNPCIKVAKKTPEQKLNQTVTKSSDKKTPFNTKKIYEYFSCSERKVGAIEDNLLSTERSRSRSRNSLANTISKISTEKQSTRNSLDIKEKNENSIISNQNISNNVSKVNKRKRFFRDEITEEPTSKKRRLGENISTTPQPNTTYEPNNTPQPNTTHTNRSVREENTAQKQSVLHKDNVKQSPTPRKRHYRSCANDTSSRKIYEFFSFQNPSTSLQSPRRENFETTKENGLMGRKSSNMLVGSGEKSILNDTDYSDFGPRSRKSTRSSASKSGAKFDGASNSVAKRDGASNSVAKRDGASNSAPKHDEFSSKEDRGLRRRSLMVSDENYSPNKGRSSWFEEESPGPKRVTRQLSMARRDLSMLL